MNLEKVVIIIPTYNEAIGIEQTIHEVFSHTVNCLNHEICILIFDSASTDNTAEKVKSLQSSYPNLKLQSEAKKTGLGSAYLQAMTYALNALQADVIIEFDADLSHQPKYLKDLLEVIKTCDVVVGSRYILGGSIPSDWSWHRKALSIVGNYIARFFLTFKYKDFTTGFRATRRASLLKALPTKFISSAYAYKIELLWRLHRNQAIIVEHPIDFIDRKQGYSKLPTNSILDTFKVLFRLRFAKLGPYIRICAVGAVGLCIQLLTYNLARHYIGLFHVSDIKSQLIKVLNKIPKNTPLVSLGAAPYGFLYYYILHTGKTIPIVTEQSLKDKTPPVYFCTALASINNDFLGSVPKGKKIETYRQVQRKYIITM
ncbi:MAG: polyprenol monophosphomannose synthase [Legionella sp.]|nr:polyprenol monophosphomannose synthase [Legionella sp.]